jgi:acetyl esterase/lipase
MVTDVTSPIEPGRRLDAEHRAAVERFPEDLFDLSDLDAARARLAAGPPSPPVSDSQVIVEDHRLAGAGVVVRSYRPAAAAEALPTVLWIHGGGHVLGDRTMGAERHADLAARLGLVVASVEYRLAPEHPFPAAFDDCRQALVWLTSVAHSLPVDPTRVAIAGLSAGGGLAAAVALAARGQGPPLMFQQLTAPMLDPRTGAGQRPLIDDTRFWNDAANQVGWRSYLRGFGAGERIPATAAPAMADDLTGLPPTQISVGTLDLFHDECVAFARRLEAAGVDVDLRVYEGAFHGSTARVPGSAVSRAWIRAEETRLAAAMGLRA